MSYGIKYYSLVKDLSGTTYQVNLRKSGFSGTPTGITYYDQSSPLTVSFRGDKDQADESVFGSDATFSFYVDQTKGENYDEILSSDYNTWQMEISGGTGNPFYWIGFVKPENTTRPFVISKYLLQLNASCGLADLKNVSYSIPFNQDTNFVSVAQTIKNCLDLTGLNLPIRSQVNLIEANFTGSSEIFTTLNIRPNPFYTTQGLITTFDDAYTVLQKTLEPYNSQISQIDGYWQITQKNEDISPAHIYKYSSSGANSGYVTGFTTSTFDRRITGLTFNFGSDTLNYTVPIKNYSTTFNQSIVTGTTANFLTNIIPDDTQQKKGWINGTGTTAFANFNYSGGTAFQFLDGSTPNALHMAYVNFYARSDGNTGNTLSISSDVNPYGITFASGSLYPKIRYKIIFPNGTSVTSSDLLLNSSGFHTTTASIAFTQTGTYTLQIYFVPNTGGGTSYSFVRYYLRNVRVTPTFKTNTFIQDETTLGTQSKGLQVIDKDLYFSDTIYSTSSGSIVCYNDYSRPTQTWSAYPLPISKFKNYNFTGATIGWSEKDIGGQTWSYLSGSYVNAVSTTNYYSNILWQSGMKAGDYSINVFAKNQSTVIGVNPNVALSIYEIDRVASGYSATLLASQNMISGSTFLLYSFNGLFFKKNSGLGIGVTKFGPFGNSLKVFINQVAINGLGQVYDYQQDHVDLYNLLKQRKNYSTKKFLSITLRGSNTRFNNLIYIVDGYGNGTYYSICNYTYDIQNCSTQLQLVEWTDSFYLPITG